MSFIDANTTNITATPPSPTPALLYVFSTLMVISILCYIFVFYHFLATASIRRALNNHVIILLLITYAIQTVFDTPLHLDYFRTGIYWPPTLNYCFFLLMMDYILYEIGMQLMLWASIERHILIFHPALFNTRARLLIGHYLPLSFCCVYPTVYYTYFILFYPCESYYDMSTFSCVGACFLWTNSAMAYYELIANGFLPVCLVALFSMTLIGRVLWKKRQMGRQMTWRKNRKMTIQLLGISTTFLIFNFGYFTIALVQMVRDPSFGQSVTIWFFAVNVCAPQLVFPFLCLSTLSNLGKKLKSLNPWHHRAVVNPHRSDLGQTAHAPGSNTGKSIRQPPVATLAGTKN